MLKKILIGFAVVVVALVGFIATRPATYHVERSLVVPATPPVTYAFMADLKNFESFSPWKKYEPTAKVTVDGAPTGVGAHYAWVGEQVGSGEMTIAAVKDNERIDLDLHFVAPFESNSKTSWILAKDGDQTKVTWSMDGENNFMGKAFSIVTDMDKMIGNDFEGGLATLTGHVGAAQKAADEAALKAAREAAAAVEAAAAAAAGTPPATP